MPFVILIGCFCLVTFLSQQRATLSCRQTASKHPSLLPPPKVKNVRGKKKKKKSQNPTGKKFLYLHLCKIVPQPIACNGLDEQIQQYLCCLRQHCCHLSICAKQLGPLASNRPRYLRVFNTNTTFRSLFRSWKISILVLQLQQIHCTEKHQQAKWAKGITAC